VILAAVSGFFINSNIFLFFLILLFYGLSIITLAFVITPFFDKAQSAGGMASLATMLFSVLYLAISLTREIKEDGTVTYSIPPVGRGLMCLLSPCAIAQAIDQVCYFYGIMGVLCHDQQ
jgi:ATP-binding cassette subfamily A (ABC1) protein 5